MRLSGRTGPWLIGSVGVGFVLPIVVAVVAVLHRSGQPPLPGLEEFDPTTAMVAAVVQVVCWIAALTTIGFAVTALLLHPHGRSGPGAGGARHLIPDSSERWVEGARVAARVWLLGSLLGIPFVATTAMGMPAEYALFGLGNFLGGSQTAQLWLVQAAVAFVVTVLTSITRSMGGLAVACYLGVLGLLPSVVVGVVSVGADHDLATDAAILATLAVGLWAPTAIAVAVSGVGSGLAQRVHRYQLISLPAALLVLAGGAVVTWQGLAGENPLSTCFGVVQVIGGAAGVLVVVNWFLRLGLPAAAKWRSALIDLALIGVGIGTWVSANLLPPPRFTEPQSTQINYLGYSVDTPPTLLTLIGPARPNLLIVTIALLALAGYWAGYLALRRRGGKWPVNRVVLWTAGWAVMLMVSATGLWKYSGAAFSIHMGVHMAVNMLAPVLIVMGGPITLALRVLPARRADQMPGPREVLNAVLNWRPLTWFLHPVAVWLYFVSSFYILYFSSLFDTMMRYHWAHQLMTVHFLITGLLFYGLVIGADRPPRPLPYIGKIGFLFSAMPFHAFFAVGLLASPALIAPTFYPALEVPWITDLLADQELGGQITWATGEIPMLIVIIALVFQWMGQDTKDAKRQDRAMDSGLDDSYDAYNAMLQQLANQYGEGEPSKQALADEPDSTADEPGSTADEPGRTRVRSAEGDR